MKNYNIKKEQLSQKNHVETPEEWIKMINQKQIEISMLSNQTGISYFSLKNKFNPKHPDKFTYEEFKIIQKILLNFPDLHQFTKQYPFFSE